MRSVNPNQVLLRHILVLYHLIKSFINTKRGSGKLHILFEEYWFPGEENRDRLMQECRRRALQDSQTRSNFNLSE